MARKFVDCREHPSEVKCSLTIAGEEEEVLKAAVQHAVTAHGEEDSPDLRQHIREMMHDVSGGQAEAHL